MMSLSKTTYLWLKQLKFRQLDLKTHTMTGYMCRSKQIPEKKNKTKIPKTFICGFFCVCKFLKICTKVKFLHFFFFQKAFNDMPTA